MFVVDIVMCIGKNAQVVHIARRAAKYFDIVAMDVAGTVVAE